MKKKTNGNHAALLDNKEDRKNITGASLLLADTFFSKSTAFTEKKCLHFFLSLKGEKKIVERCDWLKKENLISLPTCVQKKNKLKEKLLKNLIMILMIGHISFLF